MSTITPATKAAIERIFDRADLDPAGIDWDYSGRGMFGRTCVGYVTSDGDGVAPVMFTLGYAMGTLYADVPGDGEVEDGFHNARTDSMGLDMIVYWPELDTTEMTRAALLR